MTLMVAMMGFRIVWLTYLFRRLDLHFCRVNFWPVTIHLGIYGLFLERFFASRPKAFPRATPLPRRPVAEVGEPTCSASFSNRSAASRARRSPELASFNAEAAEVAGGYTAPGCRRSNSSRINTSSKLLNPEKPRCWINQLARSSIGSSKLTFLRGKQSFPVLAQMRLDVIAQARKTEPGNDQVGAGIQHRG